MAGQKPAAAVGVQEDIPMSVGGAKEGTKRKRKCQSCKSDQGIPIARIVTHSGVYETRGSPKTCGLVKLTTPIIILTMDPY